MLIILILKSIILLIISILKIIINDVNDKAPIFSMNNFIVKVLKTILIGTVITLTIAIDPV